MLHLRYVLHCDNKSSYFCVSHQKKKRTAQKELVKNAILQHVNWAICVQKKCLSLITTEDDINELKVIAEIKVTGNRTCAH